jgi:hypothetical protein
MITEWVTKSNVRQQQKEKGRANRARNEQAQARRM